MSAGETTRGTALGADLIAQRGFMVVRRGYDQDEVRSFLDQVSGEVRALQRRVAELTDELAKARAAAQAAAAKPAAVAPAPAEPGPLDFDQVVALVGEETASVLRAARSAAIDLRKRAENEAERIVSDARQSAAEARSEAEAAKARAASAAEAIAEEGRQTARTEADAIVARARADADAVREQAEQERRRTVDGAQALREKILADLSRRRRVATVQIEQLRAGRERLLESYAVVRRTLDEVHNELERADTEARAAADEAGRRAEAAAEGDAAGEAAPGAPAPSGGGAAGGPADSASPAEASGGGSEASGDDPAGAAIERVRVIRGESGTSDPTARADTGRSGQPALRAVEGGGAAVRIIEAPSAESAVEEEPSAKHTGEVARSGADEAALQARDRLIADAEASLTKRLKRLLQDEQNELLDRLRNAGATPPAADILSPEAEQRAALLAAVMGALGDTAGDGALAIAGGDVSPDVAAPAAEALAANLLEPLRRRLTEAARGASGEDQAVLIEAIGAVYREWKTQRVEPAVGDAVVAAYAAGAYTAAPAGTLLRWVVDDVAGPCPDCDDNALAGALGRGEQWPTGQLHPPAHAGCRCLLVRADKD